MACRLVTLAKRNTPWPSERLTRRSVHETLRETLILSARAVREYLQDVLEEEMTAALGAAKGERSMVRLGYRSGYYERDTRVGRLELRVPQDRDGRFSTALFERYQRSEKALLVGARGDVCARCVDAQGEEDHRGTVRLSVLGLDDLQYRQAPGRAVAGLCPAPARRTVSLCDRRCAIREGARQRGDALPRRC